MRESFSNFLLPISPAIHTLFSGLDLIPNLMIIKWSGLLAYWVLNTWFRSTHSPLMNGEWCCIAVLEEGIRTQFNIWVMKEYDFASSWTEFPHQNPSLGMLQPGLVGFRRNGEVVLENAIRELISWNPDGQKIKNLKINGFHNTFVGFMMKVCFLDKAAGGVVTY